LNPNVGLLKEAMAAARIAHRNKPSGNPPRLPDHPARQRPGLPPAASSRPATAT